jgi:hypothetical protein
MNQDPLALPAFLLSLVGLSVAVLAAATSVVSLTWQILTRTRGAHRVRVEAQSKMKFYFQGNPDPDRDYIQLRVSNAGLSPVEVRSWAIRLKDKTSLIVLNPKPFPPSPKLPYALQPGTAIDFFLDTTDLAEGRDPSDFRGSKAVVFLSTGEIVFGRRDQIRVD